MWHWSCCCGGVVGDVIISTHKTDVYDEPVICWPTPPLNQMDVASVTATDPHRSNYHSIARLGAESFAVFTRNVNNGKLQVSITTDKGATWSEENVTVGGTDVVIVVGHMRDACTDSNGKLCISSRLSSDSKYCIWRREGEGDWTEYKNMTAAQPLYQMAPDNAGGVWTYYYASSSHPTATHKVYKLSEAEETFTHAWGYTVSNIAIDTDDVVYLSMDPDLAFTSAGVAVKVAERTGPGAFDVHDITYGPGWGAAWQKSISSSLAIDSNNGKHVAFVFYDTTFSPASSQLWYAYAAAGSWVWSVEFVYSAALGSNATYCDIVTLPDNTAAISLCEPGYVHCFIGGGSGSSGFTQYSTLEDAVTATGALPAIIAL